MPVPHITVCICTYQRPALLKRLLAALSRQEPNGLFTFSIVVADNDAAQSGREVVRQVAETLPIKVTYAVEPRRNIALVRNKALEQAHGDFVAFIDDDEFPVEGWLGALIETCISRKVAGVLGPVKPHFDQEPPRWVRQGRFYDRPAHETGFVMPWRECRTGNVLLRRGILEGTSEPFRAEFATGSEDVDFFRRMIEEGRTFIWCNEAVVYETVPPNRWKRSFMIKRALLRGKTSFKYPEGRWLSLGKTLIALPVYTLALPFLVIAGQQYFMRYLVKLCDHTGKLLALVGISAVSEREM